MLLFDCVFKTDHQTFAVYFKVRHVTGALIMTFSRHLLQYSNEVMHTVAAKKYFLAIPVFHVGGTVLDTFCQISHDLFINFQNLPSTVCSQFTVMYSYVLDLLIEPVEEEKGEAEHQQDEQNDHSEQYYKLGKYHIT